MGRFSLLCVPKLQVVFDNRQGPADEETWIHQTQVHIEIYYMKKVTSNQRGQNGLLNAECQKTPDCLEKEMVSQVHVKYQNKLQKDKNIKY